MSTQERLLVQIFDGKNSTTEEMWRTALKFHQNNVLKCIAQSSDPTEPKNEELIQKLLCPRPPLSFPYSTNHNNKDKTVNREELSDNLFNEARASNKEPNDPTILPQCLVNNAGRSLNSHPELESNASSPEERTGARILDSHHEADQSLPRFQRSKPRQKALELRNSLKAGPKSCLHDADIASSSSEGAGCITDESNVFREEKVAHCKGKERGSSNYSGRITRSRSSCQQSNHVYQSSNLNRASYVANEGGDVIESIGKPVQQHHHVKESLELFNFSSTTHESCRVTIKHLDITNESNGIREEKVDRCKGNERGSNTYSGRITRSRSSCQQSNHVYQSSNLNRTFYVANEDGDIESIGKPVQQHNHVKESFELVNSSATTNESCRATIKHLDITNESNGIREEKVDRCKGNERGSNTYSGRITRSRSSCQQSNHVYQFSNLNRTSYVASEDGDIYESIGKPVQQQHNHVKESLKLVNSSVITNESCRANKEVIGDKCTKENGSSDHCGRITRSRQSGRITRSRRFGQQSNHIYISSNLKRSSYVSNEEGDRFESIGEPMQQHNHVKESLELANPSDTTSESFRVNKEIIGDKCTKENARSMPGQMDLKLYAANTRKHQSMGNDADKYVGRLARSQHSCTIQGMSEHANSNISDHRVTRFRNAASNKFQIAQGDQIFAGMSPPSQNDPKPCTMNTGEHSSMEHVADECTCRNIMSQEGDRIEGETLPINSNISDQRQSRNAASLVKSLDRFEVDDLHNATGIDVNVLPSTDTANLVNCERSGATLEETQNVPDGAIEACAVSSGSNRNGASHRVGLEVLLSRPPSDSLMLVKPKLLDFDGMEECSLKTPYSPSLEEKRGETSLKKGTSTLLEPEQLMEEFSKPRRYVSFTKEGSWPLYKRGKMEHQPTNVFSAPPSLTVKPFQSIARDDTLRYLNEEDDSSQALSRSLHELEVAQSNNKNPALKSRQIVNCHFLEGSEDSSSELRVEKGQLSLERTDESAITSFIIEQEQLGPSLITSLTQQENASYQGCLLEKVGVSSPTSTFLDTRMECTVEENQILSHLETSQGNAENLASLERSTLELEYQDFLCRESYASPIGKLWEGTTSNSGSSEKHRSSNPELTCFPIAEDSNICEEMGNTYEAADTFQDCTGSTAIQNSTKREPLADITKDYQNPPALGCEAEKFHDRGRLDSVNAETNFTRSHNKRSGKPKAWESKPNNIVSNMTSFVPLVQQKQAPSVISGKRVINVPALKASMAAKRRIEEKEHGRKMRIEANKRQVEQKKKQKMEEPKKKDADSRKRLREGEKRKVESVRKIKKSKDVNGMHKKMEQEKREVNHGKKPKTESRTNTIFTTYIRKASIVVKDSEAFDDRGDIGMVIRNSDKAPENGKSIFKITREESYEISPYSSSDDESNEKKKKLPKEEKFVPSWASMISLAPNSMFSQPQIHPKVLFPSESFCRIDEVL